MNQNQSFVVERKVFQEKSEYCNGGTWISSNREKSRFYGFFRFWRGGDGLVIGAREIYENHRIRCKEKTFGLVVPKVLMAVGGKILGRERTRNGAEMPVGKWARAVVCESKGKIRDWCEESSVDSRSRELHSERRGYCSEEMVAKRELSLETHFAVVGRVTKVARKSLKLVDLTKQGRAEVRGLRLQKPQTLRGYELLTGPMSAIGCLIIVPIFVLQIQNRLRGERKGKVIFKCRQSQRISVSVRRKQEVAAEIEEASSTPKRNLEGGGSRRQIETLFGANLTPERAISPLVLKHPKFYRRDRGRRGDSAMQIVNKVRTPFSAVSSGSSLSGAFEPNFLPETSVSLVHLLIVSLFLHSVGVKPCRSAWFFFISPGEYHHRGGASCSEVLEPSTLPLEGFQVEGLTPRKMVKVQSVLESLRLELSGIMEKVWKERTRVLSLRTRKQSEKFGIGGLYGPNKPVWRKDFWLELQDLHGLTFPRWCVGGDFNVIRRISEKMGDSRLTVNMRCFDEFIRESGLLDPPLRNAAFTWSNMQVDPICKRFENMWLLHPEFKEKFRDWWQECTVEGWEGHKFMRKLKFIKSKTLRRKELEDLLLKEEVNGDKNLGLSGLKKGIATLSFFTEWPLEEEAGSSLKSLISERGETLNNIEVISEEIVNFFGNLYSKPEEEVRMAVFQLNKEKAPGPDGFTIAVYQECWDVIKEDLMRVFFEFHTKGSLCGRETNLDAVLIANEVVDEKRRKGFSQKWRSWMRGCLSSSSFAILVNGNAKGWVKASRGLRQGDPLSPFLFTLVADVLSRLMIRAEETGITEGFLVGRDRTRVSLLQFADDTIFFSKASLDFFKTLRLSFWFLGKVSEWPLSYLGLPLGGNPKTIGFWDPVLLPSLFKIPVSIASKIEKMQRDFLWSGAGEGKKDHLIRWEVVSRPRRWEVIASIYGTHPNGWDANMVVRWSHRCPWKAIAQVFQEFSPFVRLVVGNGERIRLKSVVFVFVRLVFSEIFFLCLVKSSNPLMFLPAKFLWSSKVPSKVKALAWLVAHGKEMESRLTTFFFIVPLPLDFGTGLGNSLRGKTLWQIACLTLIWMVWQERNNRIFEDKGRTEEMVWDLIRFYSSLWASCTEAFRGVPLSILQLNWIGVCVSRV
ncbi:putative mitochondrial protein [Vitis vinifera]|uniref:Putative mitochondrial protein n=1 Tax=Vitis vinifera TaxID=29760 RepID=A0A438GCI7_VITVI|nr:putative mitochondrial protein [Vitis vinifera]